MERGFVAVSLLLPFLWLWNSWALPSEPAWLAVLLAAGAVLLWMSWKRRNTPADLYVQRAAAGQDKKTDK